MRILHIAPSYKPAYQYGGPIISVSRLAEEQAKVGAEVWVLTTTANGSEELDVPLGVPQMLDGVQVRYFRRWTGDHGHFSPALLWAVWREAPQFQVVHLHSWWNWIAFGVAWLCRLRGLRIAISPHGMLSPYTLRGRLRRIFQKTLGRWLLGNHRLHATSKQEMWELQALHPGMEVAMLPNIVYLPDRIRHRNALAARDDAASETIDSASLRLRRENNSPLRLLFLSRIDPKKGIDLLLRALADLPKDVAWQLDIGGATGSLYQKKLAALAQTLGIADRVRWIGWVQDDAKWAMLAQSDLFILPSHNENFAIAVLEALAVGTPVVVGNQVGLHSYVAEKDLGWRTDPDPVALREVLGQAFADTEKRQRIRQTAPDRVRADFEPGKVARAYLDWYASWLRTS